MKLLALALICACAAVAATARAGQDNYQEPMNAYRADLKRTEPELVNSGFYGSVASSQAKRTVGQALAGVNDGLAEDAPTRSARRGIGAAAAAPSTSPARRRWRTSTRTHSRPSGA
ncbi:MAG TPA: hypothetical protein VFR86_24325 [Burkholderiaceae bacterium]|nr:hypothetical protein [Burkholderiaceae bacterium]